MGVIYWTCVIHEGQYLSFPGEHIDYNGYGVLPMALEQSISAAVRMVKNSGKILLRNTDDKFQ